MSTLRPRNTCWITRKTGTYDDFGRHTFSARRTRTRCSIVSMTREVDKTSVRADSTASRGRAEEPLAQARLLFLPREDLRTGDIVEVEIKGGENLKVTITSIFRRPDVSGQIHHIDAEGEIWASD